MARKTTQHRSDELSRWPEEDFIEVPVIERDYSDLPALFTYPMGDVHIGSPAHQAGRFGEWMKYLESTSDTSMIALGDMINAAIVNSKSDVYAETMTVQEAKWHLTEKLTALAQQGRVDAIVGGNHEARVQRATGEDPMYDVGRVLGIPHFEGAAFIKYKVGSQTYTIYARHGTGSGQSMQGLTKSAMVAEADVYITGHIHNISCSADEYFAINHETNKTERRRRYYVSSGAFLAYERYAAERGYKPTRMGAPRIMLNGERHEVHVSI